MLPLKIAARRLVFWLRPLGKCLPPQVLWAVFFPFAGVRSAWELISGAKIVSDFMRVPRSMRTSRFPLFGFWVQRTLVHSAAALTLFADAFSQPAWAISDRGKLESAGLVAFRAERGCLRNTPFRKHGIIPRVASILWCSDSELFPSTPNRSRSTKGEWSINPGIRRQDCYLLRGGFFRVLPAGWCPTFKKGAW
jgi:hypothetical protein